MQLDDTILDWAVGALHPHFPGVRRPHHTLGESKWRRRTAENGPGHDRPEPLNHPHRLTTPTHSQDRRPTARASTGPAPIRQAPIRQAPTIATRHRLSVVRLPDANNKIKVSQENPPRFPGLPAPLFGAACPRRWPTPA